MGRIWMPGGGGGADLDVITAGAGDVLDGKVIVDKDGNPLTGTMPNRGAVSQELAAGGSYTVPAGYHNGSGVVKAKSLASQTAGTAGAADIQKDKTAWVNGVKVTGAMTISSVVSFSIAAYSTSQVICTWKNPAKGPYSGVLIRYKTGSSPTSVTDGTQGYKGVGSNSALNGTSSVTVGGLAAGTTYYFRIWVYCTTSAGTLYSDYKSATGKTTASGRKAFTASGTWTVPANVRTISVHCTGGGGGGGKATYESNDGDTTYYGGGGGAGGYTAYKNNIAVTPGEIFNIIVGSGGTTESNVYGGTGGVSSFAKSSGTVLVSANGGTGTQSTKISSGVTRRSIGGSGGSGGGMGTDHMHHWSGTGTVYTGGSNGSSCGTLDGKTAAGQGKTTREFGLSNGTLYSGGGGGGNSGASTHSGYAGGAGGGGRGAFDSDNSDKSNQSLRNPIAGSAGTGGGGGGGADGRLSAWTDYGADGGCGNVIIKW